MTREILPLSGLVNEISHYNFKTRPSDSNIEFAVVSLPFEFFIAKYLAAMAPTAPVRIVVMKLPSMMDRTVFLFGV
jgi:hypothetical protein